ncbi:MAG: xanthine dehydrogenase family protein molybdopterin-binding subunit, partial [Gammaproteobacteria bacterium]|nr:xanthine dehydrogenase family protein molybdopterin-binding subunit [Gammaproteobacteria bacterium]
MTAASLTRRRFIVTSAAVAGALVVGVTVRGLRRPSLRGAGAGSVLNAFVRIAPSGQVTLVMPKVEMGQGTYTSLPMLIAEELEVDLDKVTLEAAPPDPAVYGFPVDPEAPEGIERDQATGTSLSIIQCWTPLRQAGATARLMLLQAAAKRWRVPLDSCHAEHAEIVHAPSGRRATYGTLARAAAALPLPAAPPLKDPKSFRLIGRATPRRDTPSKVNGSAVFGIDARPPRAKVAVLAISPVSGGRIAGPLASDTALAVRGVTQVVDEGDVVAVVAEHTWAAVKGMQALKPQWTGGDNATVQQAAIVAELESAVREPGVIAATKGNPGAAGAHAATHHEAVYHQPFLAHATLEPMNCTVDWRKDKCEIWVGTQVPDRAVAKLADLGLTPPQIELHNHLIGGGFGRRLEVDGIVIAARIARDVEGPVRVL